MESNNNTTATSILKSKVINPVTSFFAGNPLTSTEIGQRVDHITSILPQQQEENNGGPPSNLFFLSSSLEICDILNNPNSQKPTEDFLRAVKKKLTTPKTPPQSISLTLDLLEIVVKNCCDGNEQLKKELFSKEFLNDILLIAHRNSLHAPSSHPLFEKTLSLLQSWNNVFKKEFPQLQETIYILQEKGVEFPPINLDNNVSMVFTQQQKTVKKPISPSPILHPVTLPEEESVKTQVLLKPTKGQLAKIRRDLEFVKGNVDVFTEIMSEEGRNEEDERLLREIYEACVEMRGRIGGLVEVLVECGGSGGNIEGGSSDNNGGGEGDVGVVVGELIDALERVASGVVVRYSRHIRKQQPQQPQHPEPTQQLPGKPQEPTNDLISFQVESTKDAGAIPKIKKICDNEETKDDHFDEFAKMRSSSKGQTPQSMMTPEQMGFPRATSTNPNISTIGAEQFTEEELENVMKTHTESDFSEMESWLRENDPANCDSTRQQPNLSSSHQQPQPPTTLSSSEFDKFLEERLLSNKK